MRFGLQKPQGLRRVLESDSISCTYSCNFCRPIKIYLGLSKVDILLFLSHTLAFCTLWILLNFIASQMYNTLPFPSIDISHIYKFSWKFTNIIRHWGKNSDYTSHTTTTKTFSNQKSQKICSSFPVVLRIISVYTLLQDCLVSKALNARPLPTPMPYICVKTLVYKIFYIRNIWLKIRVAILMVSS